MKWVMALEKRLEYCCRSGKKQKSLQIILVIRKNSQSIIHLKIYILSIIFSVAHTRSQFPSSVQNFTANPRGSLTVSAEPLSPPTVENRMATLVRFPIFSNTFALQYFVMSLVTSKQPNAPENGWVGYVNAQFRLHSNKYIFYKNGTKYLPAPLAWTCIEKNTW